MNITLSNRFFRFAVLYLLAGVALGIGMAASHNHAFYPVHAHLNLLGWVTMALFGGFYRLWPRAAESRLATLHFWVYAPALLVMMASLAALYAGIKAVEPLLGLSSVLVGVGIVLFAIVAWKATAGIAREVPAGVAAHA